MFGKRKNKDNIRLCDFRKYKNYIISIEDWSDKIDNNKFSDEIKMFMFLRDYIGWNRTTGGIVEWTSDSSSKTYKSDEGENGLYYNIHKEMFPPTNWDNIKKELDKIDNKYITKYYWKYIDD